MPNSVRYSDQYNKKLYDSLLKLFQSWGNIPQPEDLAWVIAHQSSLETEVRRQKIHRGLNVTERMTTAKRYLASLHKARDMWSEMENDDQSSLSQCVEELTNGHDIMDVLELEQILSGYGPHQAIAEWRKPALNKHRSWGLDTEMLDLLIGAAKYWMENKTPVAHEKIDPTLYAVIYMCGNCENHNIIASSSDTGRFTKVVSAYFQHTNFLDDHEEPEKRKNSRKDFKDIIEKANVVWKRDYPNDFIQFEEPDFPEQLELFGYV